MPNARHPRLTHDQQIMLYALLAGAPAVAVALYYLWLGTDSPPRVQLTFTLLVTDRPS